MLRAQKNRYGRAGEVGLFAMEGEGLAAVANPAELFTNARVDVQGEGVGAAVAVVQEGVRPLVIEVQVRRFV